VSTVSHVTDEVPSRTKPLDLDASKTLPLADVPVHIPGLELSRADKSETKDAKPEHVPSGGKPFRSRRKRMNGKSEDGHEKREFAY
jgi:hypothetical protein